jgi:hypothetical protein
MSDVKVDLTNAVAREYVLTYVLSCLKLTLMFDKTNNK